MSYLSKIIQLDQTQFTKILSGLSVSQNGYVINSYDSSALYMYDKFVPEWSKGADMSNRSYKSFKSDVSSYSKYAKYIFAYKIGTNTLNYNRDDETYDCSFYIPLINKQKKRNKSFETHNVRYSSKLYFEGDENDSSNSTIYGPIFDIKRLWVSDDIIFKSTIDIKYQKDSNKSGRILMGDNDGISITSTSSKKINIHTDFNEIDISQSGFYVKADGNSLIKLSTSGSNNYINGNSNLIINGGSNYINFDTSNAGIYYQSATWTEKFKSLIIDSSKSIQMTGATGNCYFYAGTDGDPYKLEIGSYGVSYIKFDKNGIADFYGEVRFRGNVTFKGLVTHEKDVLPSTNNSKNLGSSSYHWKSLYVGTADTYGSPTQPIYWNNGVPTPVDYVVSVSINNGTANRMAWYDTSTSIASTDNIQTNGSYIHIINDTDISGTVPDTSAPFTIGTLTGTHISMDGNEILAKTNATTPGTLYLQDTTGTVQVNGSGGLKVWDINIATGATTDKTKRTISSNSTLYLNSAASTSLIFNKADSEMARFDTSSNLVPSATNVRNLGSASLLWQWIHTNKINLNREGGTAYGRIYYYKSTYYTWVDYMSNSVAGAAPTGGQPSTTTEVNNWAKRSLIENSAGFGWIWESCANASVASSSTKPTARMSLSANTGQLRIESSAATTTTNKGSLIISSVANGSSSNVSIELWRGGNVSWSISNETGDFHIRDNYTTTAQTTFLHDNVRIAYNTGNISLKNTLPFTTNTYTLGSTTLRWANVYSVLGNFSGQITSSVASGTSPFIIDSSTLNTNLNADLLDGYHQSSFMPILHYEGSDSGVWYKVRINVGYGSMFSITVKVNGGYVHKIFEISGYNYSTNKGWYSQTATCIVDSQYSLTNKNNIVVFGKDGDGEIWFAVYASDYNGIEIIDSNFYWSNKPSNRRNAFTVTMISAANVDEEFNGIGTVVNSYTIAVVKSAKLAKARDLKVNLSSSSSQSFDGTADASAIGVSGTLPFTNLPTMKWADQNVSDSSSTTTTPQFARIGLGAAVNDSYSVNATGTILSTASPGFANEVDAGNWSYNKYTSGTYTWAIGTISNTTGYIGQAGAFEIRSAGASYSGISVRYNTSANGKLVITVPSGECTIGFRSAAAGSTATNWVMGVIDSNNRFGFYNNAGSKWRANFSPNGNLYLGDGNTAASYRLHVVGDAYITSKVYVVGSGNFLGSDSNNTNIYLSTNGKYVTLHNSENAFRRGTAATNNDITLGTSTYRWKAGYNVEEFIGSASGSQCHLKYDTTDNSFNFIFD